MNLFMFYLVFTWFQSHTRQVSKISTYCCWFWIFRYGIQKRTFNRRNISQYGHCYRSYFEFHNGNATTNNNIWIFWMPVEYVIEIRWIYSCFLGFTWFQSHTRQASKISKYCCWLWIFRYGIQNGTCNGWNISQYGHWKEIKIWHSTF